MYALQTKGKITIGALDNAAPFSSRDASGRYSGFEPDLSRELAKAIFGPRQDIDTVIEWISVDPGSAVTALTSLQADVIIARLPITDERAALIDLSDTYFVTGEHILISSSNDEIKDLADLDTKTVLRSERVGRRSARRGRERFSAHPRAPTPTAPASARSSRARSTPSGQTR